MTKKLDISIPIGIGDLLHLFAQLDSVKHLYSEINLAFYEPFFGGFRHDSKEYREFLDLFCKKLFSDKIYKFVSFDNQPLRNCSTLLSQNGIPPIRPRLKSLLTEPIENIYGDYLVVTTKTRQLSRTNFNNIKNIYFEILNKLTNKYKIMILGEREIEYNPEYTYFSDEHIYSLYNDYINNLSSDKIIDLTIPKLGVTAPDLNQYLKDCSLMGNAKYNITLGIGGNFCTAVAIGSVIGYRVDDDHVADLLYKDIIYPDCMVTKNFNKFISHLENI